MSAALNDHQEGILARLIDGLYPAVDTISGALQAGVLTKLLTELEQAPWNGQSRYSQGPFVHPEHAGHGWQSQGSPAESLAASLTELDTWSVQTYGVPITGLGINRLDLVLQRLSDGSVRLSQGISSVDLFKVLHRSVFEAMHGEANYGWVPVRTETGANS
jgi:hypothetical protein